jgi:hypothetical protein
MLRKEVEAIQFWAKTRRCAPGFCEEAADL